MNIGPYFQNLPTEVTVTFPGGTASSLTGDLIDYDKHGITVVDVVDINFIPWSAVGALSVSKKLAQIPAYLRGESNPDDGEIEEDGFANERPNLV